MLTPTASPEAHPQTPSLDGRRFILKSSTASAVNEESPSLFRYSEQDGVIWGDYEGDTVTFGRMVGTRVGDLLEVQFVHVMVDGGAVVSGSSASTIEVDATNHLSLVENFRIHDTDHVSVCVEIAPAGASTIS
ncbi:hypothetical protein [Glaciihabitans sp. dw_435]|uniref:hypothetical protein n=1 Tax=Glaciihabitans sp. dw_435 TaxID=2720081 RepID=UPI0027DD09CE|nr:hypothetical protein [Glaciihabitans sp. dw_435]